MSESPLSLSPYEVLGVAASVSDDELRKAFRKALRETHPDTGGDPKRFTAVQLAWERIGSPEKRAAYDAGRSTRGDHPTFTAQPARPRQDTRPARSQIKNAMAKDGFIKGQYNTLQSIEFHPGYHLFSVVLQSYGLKQLFNIRANELLNAVIDVKEHPLTASLAEWLNGVGTINPAVVQHVSATLQAYPLQPVSHSTLTFIELIRNTSENKIGDLLKNTGIELRTLQRKFKNEVGLTPKEFIRIVRMKRLEADISSGKNLLQIVADFDFTIQQVPLFSFFHHLLNQRFAAALIREKIVYHQLHGISNYVFLLKRRLR